MRFVPVHSVAEMSGKWCKKQSGYVAFNKKTGKMYHANYHKRKDPNTEDQQAIREAFTAKSRAASTWWAANKPSSTNTEGTALYQQFAQMYDAQIEIGNRYSFCRSLINSDNKIVIKGVAYDATATSPSTSGGGNEGGGGSGSGALS